MVIYKTINLISNKWYIGKDATNTDSYLGSGKALINAIRKYGKQNFKKEILEVCVDLPHLAEREAHWILTENAVLDPMSYNLVPGGSGGDRSKFIDYGAIDRTNYKMVGTAKWFQSLTASEKNKFHADQAKSRCKGWYVSKVDDTQETFVLNIAEWCRKNSIGTDTVSNLTNPKHVLFQKQTKGWRFRKEGQSPLLPYADNRKIGHPNVAGKGKSWKLIDGKRIWVNKEETI